MGHTKRNTNPWSEPLFYTAPKFPWYSSRPTNLPHAQNPPGAIFEWLPFSGLSVTQVSIPLELSDAKVKNNISK